MTLDIKQISKYVVSENEFEKLQKENIDLQSKIKDHEKTLLKFIKEKNNFEKPPGSQIKLISIKSMSIGIQKVSCHFYNQ